MYQYFSAFWLWKNTSGQFGVGFFIGSTDSSSYKMNRFPSSYYRPQRSWAKVISLQACVCPQGGGGTWPGPGGVSEILGGGSGLKFGGVSGLKFSGGVSENFFFFFFPISFLSKKSCWDAHPPPPRDGQCAAGTHPNGMHSCLN